MLRVVVDVQTGTRALVLALALAGCRTADESPARGPTIPVEPAASEPEPEPQTEPEPEPAAEPETPQPPTWLAVAEPEFIQSERRSGSARRARYLIEQADSGAGDRLRYELELRVGEDSTSVRLTEKDSGHVLDHTWTTSLCDYEFYDGDGAGAALGERARDPRGRKLLELWVTCSIGEDIRSTESVMLLVVSDAAGLSLLWSGTTRSHGSHVCSEWSDIEVAIQPPEVEIHELERAAIYEPESLPDYDCENAQAYERSLAKRRLPLP